MARAAVPQYVIAARGFADCPPGHRFNLYFEVWQDDWQLDKNHKANALRQTLSCKSVVGLLKEVRKRQQTLADALPEDRCHIIEARSTSPFATGLGLEHPVENGFAFLSPYGLPYLAGSGVKGVLRRAAEELELDKELPDGVALALFGHEGANDAQRGALTCWDVFPRPAGDSLVVEIMTPHFTHYLQNKGTPHDAGKPNPIPFLAVPARSEFRFVVTCEPAQLPPDIADWKAVIDKILHHAFDWLGFGAKTAVGYGAMTRLTEEEVAEQAKAAEAAALTCPWVDAKIAELAKQNNSKPSDALRGRQLAQAWAALDDPDLRQRALADIRARWEKEGWWVTPPGSAAKAAKAVYESGG